MKQRTTLCLSLLLSLLLALSLLPTAGAAPTAANYEVTVEASDGQGLNLRAGPGTEYAALRSAPIPMYTRLHISQTDTSSTGAPWGYTSYDGTAGWVCLVETQRVTSTGKVVSSGPTAANYDVYVNAKDGQGLNMRTQAGTEYPVLRSSLIPMYTRLHITQTDTSSTGALWGYTTYEDISGWVCLVETTTYDPRPAQTPETSTPDPQQPEETPPAEDAQSQPETGEVQDQPPASQLNAVLIGVVIGLLAAILVVLVVLLRRRK